MSTLDPRVEIPDNAPLAQGHTPEDREANQKALKEHKDQVKAEAGQPEVGARAPGDHAKKSSKKGD